MVVLSLGNYCGQDSLNKRGEKIKLQDRMEDKYIEHLYYVG